MRQKDELRLIALGEFLRYHRDQLHWTMRDVTQKTGFGQPWISEVERGLRCPDIFSLMRLAKVLRISTRLMAYELDAILMDVKDAPPKAPQAPKPPKPPKAPPPIPP